MQCVKFLRYVITPSKRPALNRLLVTKTRARLDGLRRVQAEVNAELHTARGTLLHQTKPADMTLWAGVAIADAFKAAGSETSQNLNRLIAATVVVALLVVGALLVGNTTP